MFLSAGRHAGPNGDVSDILGKIVGSHPGLIPIVTDLVPLHAFFSYIVPISVPCGGVLCARRWQASYRVSKLHACQSLTPIVLQIGEATDDLPTDELLIQCLMDRANQQAQ